MIWSPDSSRSQGQQPPQQPPLYSSQAVSSWRIDVCQICCTHLQASFHETLHRFPAGSSWKYLRRQHEIRQFLKVSGLAFSEAQRSICTRAGLLDSNTRRNRDTGLYHVLNTHARSYRRIDRKIRTSARAYLNRSRAARNRNCRRNLQMRGCVLSSTLLAPPRLQPAIHVSQMQIPEVPPPASQHLAVPEVQDRPHCLSRPVPGPLQPQVPHLVCVCELANARDPEDHALFAVQSFSDTLPCEVLPSAHGQQCQNTLHSRSSHHTFSSLPS